MDSSPAVFHSNRAVAYGAKGDAANAIADWNNAIEREANNAVWLNLRGLQLLKQAELDKAIADFTAAIRTDPNLAVVYANRADARRVTMGL